MKAGIFLAALAAPGIVPADLPAQPGFCQRLAAGTGMRQVKQLGPNSLEVETKGLGAKLLFGGGYTFAIGVLPVSPGLEKPEGNGCDVVRKGAACTIIGPALLRLTVKGSPISTEARPGERADVQLVGSRVRCTQR